MKNYYSYWRRLLPFAFCLMSVFAPLDAKPLACATGEQASATMAGINANMAFQPRKMRFGEKLLFKTLEKRWKKQNRKVDNGALATANGREKGVANENTASMILGIASIPLISVALAGYGAFAWAFLLLGIAAAVCGLVFGIIGVKRGYPNKGMGIAGIITSGISLGILLLYAILILILIAYLFQ